ncbi:MAG TPA: beta-N-acetylhexosaminidase [Chryseolinea sp.]|nr:beta-N-acetylhexosaminidase [Chryseolinea sp.]
MVLRLFIFTISLNFFGSITLHAQAQVIPALQQWASKKGTFLLTSKSSIVVDPSVYNFVQEDLTIFQEELYKVSNLRLALNADLTSREVGDIVLLPSQNPAAAQPEGYSITITDQVTISAATGAGFFYGLQTILQSLVQSSDKVSLTRGSGYDYPIYKERGVMLDVGRKFFEVAYIKKTIRDLAWYKLNFLHLHFTEWHSFRLQSTLFPGLAAKESYSKQDIAEIEAYARKYHVTIVPEIDLPAHATTITNYNPNLGFTCQSMREAKWQGDSTNQKGQAWVLDVTKPETEIWVKALLDEFIPLFHGPYFHVGGDEWQYDDQKEACPELMKAMHDSGFQYPADVLVDFMNRISIHVKTRGKRTQMWSWWNYTPNEKQTNKYSIEPNKDIVINIWNAPTMDAILQSGWKSIVTREEGEGSLYVTPFYGKKPGDYGFVNSKANYETWNPSTHNNVLGFKLCIWADGAENMPSAWYDTYADLPKAVLAERIWSKAASPTVEQFQLRVKKAKKASELFGADN